MDKNSIAFSRSNFRWKILKDLIAMIILFVLSIYVVYFTSQDIARVFFLLLLLLFLFSKKDYFWFAYFFIVVQGPGYFFYDFSGASLYRLPLYTFLQSMSFTPIDLFVLIALLKALDRGRKMRLKLNKPLLILLAYIIFSVAVSSIIYGVDVDVLAWNLRWFFYYSIIVSFLYLVNKKHKIYRFILLTFPMVFIILFTQIYYVTTGSEFINLFNPGFRNILLNTVTGTLRPVMGGILIVFFSFVFSIFLLVNKDYKLSSIFLYILLVVAFSSVFLSATRIWFVIFSFTLAGYVVVSKKKILSTIAIISIFLVIVSILMYFGAGQLSPMFQSSWLRLRQVFDVVGGDFYSVDTAMNRIVTHFPRIMEMIKQNPFIGYGFSYVTINHYDNDLGFPNTILMFGVIGFFLFIFFFVKMFEMLISSIKRISISNPFRTPLKIMIITWTGMLIGYFSTWDFFTWYFNKVFFVSVLIALAEFFVMQADKEELCAKHKW